MHSIKKLTARMTLAGLLMAGTAHATGLIAGAMFPQQIIQEATAVEQLNNAVQQVQQGFQSLYNQAMNLKSIGQDANSSLGPLMNQLINTAAQGSQLSYAGQNITQQFQQLYPGWHPGQDYGQQYQNWRNTTNANMQNELTAAGLQSQSFATENQALDSARNLSQSAAGRLQAILAGNQISGMQVQQIQQLRQIIMNEQQSQVAYRQQQAQAEQAGDSQAAQAVQDFTGSPPPAMGSFQMGHPFPAYH